MSFQVLTFFVTHKMFLFSFKIMTNCKIIKFQSFDSMCLETSNISTLQKLFTFVKKFLILSISYFIFGQIERQYIIFALL